MISFEFSKKSLILYSDEEIIDSLTQLSDGLNCHVYKGDIELWLSKVLGIYATLARRTKDSRKTLANEGAFLLVYEESVREIQSKLKNNEIINHQRFRPNLVVDRNVHDIYPAAYSEDKWKSLRTLGHPKIEWKSIGPCQRCSVVNIDPNTGNNESRLFTRLQTERRETNAFRANFGILLSLSDDFNQLLLSVDEQIEIY